MTSANRGAGPRENRGEGTGVVRVATQERTAGESLKRVESGRNGELRRKKPNNSKSKKGEREEAMKKKRGSREYKPREAGGFDSSVPTTIL